MGLVDVPDKLYRITYKDGTTRDVHVAVGQEQAFEDQEKARPEVESVKQVS